MKRLFSNPLIGLFIQAFLIGINIQGVRNGNMLSLATVILISMFFGCLSTIALINYLNGK